MSYTPRMTKFTRMSRSWGNFNFKRNVAMFCGTGNILRIGGLSTGNEKMKWRNK